jgi:hypothetical protein
VRAHRGEITRNQHRVCAQITKRKITEALQKRVRVTQAGPQSRVKQLTHMLKRYAVHHRIQDGFRHVSIPNVHGDENCI